MKKGNPKKIHFLGIGGSGASAAAIIAKKSGFDVTGCNLGLNTPYIKKVKDYKIKLFDGHSKDHMEDADILATTPALFFSEQNIEELDYARKNKTVMSWQKFVGDHLLKDKKVISIAGTHGKSTTTAMAGLMMEQADLDPTVIIGAKVPKWGANFRWGESDLFIIESDEFFNNFHNYKPDYLILNNIEYDHPDFFNSKEEVIDSFKEFINNLKGEKVLIVNQDSKEVRKLLEKLSKSKLKQFKVIGYTTKKRSLFKFDSLYKAEIKRSKRGKTKFIVNIPTKKKLEVTLQVPGEYNISNSLAALALLDQLDADLDSAISALKDFKGVGRRLQIIGENDKVKVFDDYAHHPTAIRVTLDALRSNFKKENIIAVIEPHSFSRTKKLLDQYKDVFDAADSVIIGPIYKARDTQDFGISGKDVVKASGHKKIFYIHRLEEIINKVEDLLEDKKNIVVVMGAGNSYKWARNIYSFL